MTNLPQAQSLGKDCHFGVSPVNYSDSDLFGWAVRCTAKVMTSQLNVPMQT